MDTLYKNVLKSYEDRSPKVELLRKIRGLKAFRAAAAALFPDGGPPAAWLSGWTDAEKRGAKGFLYRRHLARSTRVGFKLVSLRGGKESILGEEVPEARAPALLAKFK